jgi:cytochrome c oxidase subunit 4
VSTPTTDHDTHPAEPAHDVGQPDARHEHPSDAFYIKVALALAGITAIEVLLYYKDLGSANNYALLVLSAIKFVAVVAFFMHLKFDNRVLRRLFVGGFILACFVYIAYMLTLGVFVGQRP